MEREREGQKERERETESAGAGAHAGKQEKANSSRKYEGNPMEKTGMVLEGSMHVW